MSSDLDLLTERILDFGRAAVIEDGFVIPIAATVSVDGHVVPLRRIQPIDERDTTESLVKGLVETLRSLVRDGRVRAVAWCFDARLVPPDATEKTDALVVLRESASEASMLIAPYHGAPGPGTTFAAPYAQPKAREIFGAG